MKDRIDRRILQKGIDASTNGIIIFSDQSNHFSIIHANPAAQKMLNMNDHSEKNFIKLLIQAHRNQPSLGIIHQALENKTDGKAELSYSSEEGQESWYQIHISPIRNNDDTVDNFVGIFVDVTETRRLSEQIINQATHDPLTGLTNRVLLIDRMNQYIAQAKRYNFLVAVLFIDLDNFNEINEKHGHETGDLILQNIARRLVKALRESDTVARIGGDEFILVTMPISNENSCYTLIDRVNQTIQEPIRIEDKTFNLTCSIGITMYPRHGADPSTLIKNADIALFSAKESGRNTWQYFDENILKGAKVRLLKEDLDKALKNNEFELYYQPLVALTSNKITGMEALIRWHHPDRGLMMPMEFIPLAEENGSMIEIGNWVLKTACAQAKKWQDLGMKDLMISINISPTEMKEPDFVEKVRECLEATNLQPQFLELEIAEHFVLANIQNIAPILDKLHALNICLAIDDFGSGDASLSFLKKYPFSRIKINHGILQNIHRDEDRKQLVKTIMDMANTLNLTVVAEGIETQEQWDILKSLGHPEIQGFYISPPVPRDDMYTMLSEKFSNLLD